MWSDLIKKIQILYLRICRLFYIGQLKEFELQVKLVKIIVNSLDPEELKNKIVREIAVALNASRCFIIEYDSVTNNFKKVTNAYNTKRDSLSVLGYDIEKSVPSMATKFKYMKSLVIENAENFIKKNNLKGLNEDLHLRKYNIKAVLVVRLEFGENLLGVLVVHYDTKRDLLKEFDLKFIKNVAEHISIALHLSTLYTEEKSEKEKEQLLRSIISIMSSGYNLPKITKKIFEILGSIYNAQTIIININTEYYHQIHFYDLSKGNIENDPEQDLIKIYDSPEFDVIKTKSYYISDTHNFVIQNNLEKSAIEKHFTENNIQSVVLLPILYENLSFGLLIMHFEKHNQINSDEKKFIKTIADQLAIAVKQAQDYEKEKKNAKREKILRDIIEKIRSSLDIEETMQKIVNIIGETLNADRCFIMEYDKNQNAYLRISNEYVSSEDIIPYKGTDVNKDVPHFAEALKNGQNIIINNGAISMDIDITDFNDEEIAIDRLKVLSAFALPLNYQDEFLGALVIHYVKEKHSIIDDDINLMTQFAHQIALAIYQSRLYNITKVNAEREKLIGAITATAINTFDINQIKQIVTKIGVLAKADRCYFVEVDLAKMGGKNIYYDGEYLSSPGVKSVMGYDFPAQDVENFVKMYLETKDIIVFDYESILQMQSEEYKGIKKYINQFELKSGIGIPIFIGDRLTAVLAIEYTTEKVFPSIDELNFLKILGDEARVVFNQIQLYQDTKKTAEREKLLRVIIEQIRSSLDLNETLFFICKEVAKVLNVQRATIVKFANVKNYREFILKKEYKESPSLKGFTDIDEISDISEFWGNKLIKTKDFFAVDSILEADAPEHFKQSYNKIGVKSLIGTLINKADDAWGNLVLSEYNNIRHWSEEDAFLLRTIADQIYIAIKQAELYEAAKLAAERERISRNIIEILRSSIDKTIIKKLFVKNIGKFFAADRVFFSEYDAKKNMYQPVDKDSEYLSSSSEKSFIGYDWSNPDIKEHIQPLLEKREIKIFDWDEYVKQNPALSEGFISLYEDSDVRSSYNFPVLYQNNLIGYFCLEFTQQVNKLSEEDIGRIRSICTQAGIAMYHAELYVKAQECIVSREAFISDIADKITKPANDILDTSKLLANNEFKRIEEIEYLNHIISSCNQLLELTKNFSKDFL